MVDDLDDGRKLSVVLAALDEDNAADLDQSPLTRFDVGVTHFDVSEEGISIRSFSGLKKARVCE